MHSNPPHSVACLPESTALTIYTSAPLPFTGQKRFFIKPFAELLRQNLPHQGEGWMIVDVFGGSGLLAHVAKRTLPQANVIYNDFDNYSERLTHLHDINRLRQKLAAMLVNQPTKTALSPSLKAQMIDAVNNFDGYVDLDCLASWLLFSGQTLRSKDELKQQSLYNRVRKTDFPEATDYLKGIEITRESYETLLPTFVNQTQTLLVLDPPYVRTKQGNYRHAPYFGMVAFLNLMRFVRPPFVFFSSTKSEFLDYVDWVIQHQYQGWQNLIGYQKQSIMAYVNATYGYEDHWVYRF